jgi:hypothetical protein
MGARKGVVEAEEKPRQQDKGHRVAGGVGRMNAASADSAAKPSVSLETSLSQSHAVRLPPQGRTPWSSSIAFPNSNITPPWRGAAQWTVVALRQTSNDTISHRTRS